MNAKHAIICDLLKDAAEADQWAHDHLAFMVRESLKAGLTTEQVSKATGLADWEITLVTGEAA